MRDELLSPNEINEENDSHVDMSLQDLRPGSLKDFVGQAELKEHLEIILGAAQKRGKPSDHLLFPGPPGLGKRTLANIVAAERGLTSPGQPGPAPLTNLPRPSTFPVVSAASSCAHKH